MRNRLRPKFLPPRFVWRNDNRFELLVDGKQYFPAMLQAIAEAKHSIELEMYLAASGRVFKQFSEALIAAAARGVQVRILLDGYGAKALQATDREALHVGNIQLRWFNKLRWRQGVGNFLRNHRKLLLIDETLAYVGGTGLTDEFLYADKLPVWHEVMLAIHGPVVSDWLKLFDYTWFGLHKRYSRQVRKAVAVSTSQQRGRVCASSGPRAHHVTASLYQQLQLSQQRVWLVTPYFLPPLRLRRLLVKAARQHLDVRVLVPGRLTDHPAVRHASRRHYARLLRQGVRIFEYQPSFIHAKIALCDDWVSMGSTNFDRWNLLWNLDANQEIEDVVFAAQLKAMLEQDFANSEELLYDRWQQRPLYLRCIEWCTGLLDELLSKLK